MSFRIWYTLCHICTMISTFLSIERTHSSILIFSFIPIVLSTLAGDSCARNAATGRGRRPTSEATSSPSTRTGSSNATSASRNLVPATILRITWATEFNKDVSPFSTLSLSSHLSVCMSMSVHVSILSIQIAVHQDVRPSIFVIRTSVCLSQPFLRTSVSLLNLSVWTSDCLSPFILFPSVCQCLSVRPSVRLLVCLSMCGVSGLSLSVYLQLTLSLSHACFKNGNWITFFKNYLKN